MSASAETLWFAPLGVGARLKPSFAAFDIEFFNLAAHNLRARIEKMGEIILLAFKSGVAALPLILTEYGLFAAVFAFFAFMPLGHFTIGVLLVITGAFVPKIPDPNRPHDFAIGGGHSTVKVNGTGRTVLFAVGALAIVGSFFEVVK